MLPGNTPYIGGGKPPVTYGLDADTVSLIGFDEHVPGTSISAGMQFIDRAKPSRKWSAAATGSIQGPVFAGGASLYTDGSLISSPSSDPDYNFAGDWTIDFWWLPTSGAVGVTGGVLGKYNAAGNCPWLFYQSATTLYFYSSSNGTSWDIANGQNFGGGFGPASWWHIAAERYGNLWSGYANGNRVWQFTSAAATMVTNDPVTISSNVDPLAYYIDEIRFSKVARVKGAAAFPIRRSPYYGALNGQNDDATKMLLHCNGDVTGVLNFVDVAVGANTKRTYTAYGARCNVSNTKFGKSAMQATVGAGTDRVVFEPSGDWSVGWYGDFTVDLWYYPTIAAGAGSGNIISHRTSSGGYSDFVLWDSGGGVIQLLLSTAGTGWDTGTVTIGTIPLNQWSHIALVFDRGNGVIRAFLNGVQLINFSSTVGFGYFGNQLSIGGLSDGYSAQASIDEIRISNVARWTANFTPQNYEYVPAIPDSYTKALLHFDNNVQDCADPSHQWFLGGSAAMTGAGGKFGGCLMLTGAGAKSVVTQSSVDWNFGAGDFTVDWWEFRISTGAAGGVLVRDAALGYSPYLIGYEAGGTVYFLASSTGSSWDLSNGSTVMGTVTLNTWIHRAVQRSGNTWTVFQNGVAMATWTNSGSFPVSTASLSIGEYVGSWFNGYLDELRISKGIARYPAGGFTPKTTPYDPVMA